MWIKIIFVTEIFFTVGQVRSGEIHSEACVSSVGPCSHHSMRCNDHSVIGFSSVRFEERSDVCRAGVNNCSSECCQEATGGTRVNLTINQLSNLYRNCSMKQTCTYRMLKTVANIFTSVSFLQYVCFHRNDTINVTEEHTEKSGNDITILYRRKDLQEQSGDFEIFNCIVNHGGSHNAAISVNALDFSLDANSRSHLTIKMKQSQTFNSSHPFYPYQKLTTSNIKQMNIFLQIYPARHRETVWIRLSSSSTFRVKCVNVKQPTTGEITTQETSSALPETSGFNTGAVAGGVIAAVLVIVAVVLVLLWFRHKRNQKSEPPLSIGKTPGENYSVDTRISDHNYHDIETVKPKESMSNYDYATVAEGQMPLEEDYAKMGDKRPKETSPNNTTLLTAKPFNNKSFAENEDDYNHLAPNEEMKTFENGAHSGGYDTAVSASKSVQKIRNKGISSADNDYDYNHIGNNPKPKPLQGDYDTTDSASKAVAKMIETKEQTEDDYDHFRQTKAECQAADSPYDTAVHQTEQPGDYSIAGSGVLQKNDPYDLAK